MSSSDFQPTESLDRRAPASQPMEHWHLKKEVQLSHILTTASAIVAIITYVTAIETKVEKVVLTQGYEHSEASIYRTHQGEVNGEFKNKLDKIESKLDLLLERKVK